MYEQRLVAFIDILGFKSLVKESEKNHESLRVILDAVSFLKTLEPPENWEITTIEIEESAQKKGVGHFDIKTSVQCTCFSDSLVVSVLCDEKYINEATSTLIANLSLLGAALIKKGVLIRGGLSIGKLFHSNNGVVLGQGMINAYELESKLAKYPRVILSAMLLEKLNYPITKKCDSYPYHQYLKRYDDGCVGFCQLRYFQVLQSWVDYTRKALLSDLAQAKKTIIGGLNKSLESPGVYEKYIWLKTEYDALVILDDGVKEKINAIPENTIHYPT